jgi:uncharacterized protein YhbP (UPF0306 family)
MTPPFSADALDELLRVHAMTLATLGEDGEPHAATVYFVAAPHPQATASPGFTLYFFSDPHSQHSLDIARQPRAAAALHPESDSWQDIRGLQLRGVARRVEPGREWDLAWENYRLKFPFVIGLVSVVRRNALYAFEPRWIRLVDNRRGFGFKQEWTIPGS